jgi:hypothetical protein
VRVQQNVPGHAALRGDGFLLEMPRGISVFEYLEAPRLPLIGVRTIVANKLVLMIDRGRPVRNPQDQGLALIGRRNWERYSFPLASRVLLFLTHDRHGGVARR